MRRAFAMAALLGAAGCSMIGPDYQRPDTELPASYGEAGSSKEAGTPAEVSAQWWTLYGDATLDQLVAEGLARNADLREAVARVDEAEAVLREAHAVLFFPQFTGSAGVARSAQQLYGVRTGFAVGVSTAFEVDLWGRLRRAEAATQERLLATRYARDTIAIALAATIARSYFAARSLDTQYVASESILRAATDSEVLAQKRLDAGVASALDLYQAGTLRTGAAAQLKELSRQRAAVVHQLAVLVGRPGLTLATGDVATLPIVPVPPPGLPSLLLERRPDVRAAEASLVAATHRIGVAKGDQIPALTLTGSFGAQSGDLDSLFTPAGKVWSIGAGLLGPIIDGGRYAARTEQAEAQARQAAAAYQRSVQTAFREVADALSNVRLAGATEVDLREHLEEARKGLALAQSRYERGYSAYLEVLDAQRTLNDAQLLFIRNRQAYLSYSVDLMNALGGGWTS